MSTARVLHRERLYHIINRHIMEGLALIPDESISCVVTSPPYWGLRSYGTDHQVWGGDPECHHDWSVRREYHNRGDSTAGPKQKSNVGAVTDRGVIDYALCGHCGAWCGELGQEPTVALYVEHLVAVFREVRRTLHPTGVCFLNIADSYGAGGGKQVVQTKNASHGLDGTRMKTPGIRSKDLCLVPQRLAIALQDDGWYVRQIIIWSKPNPMPESVEDRCTTTHEYIFHLAKNKHHYWDREAIMEDTVQASVTRDGSKRNARSVWTIATKPFKGAHFAVFPPALAERCILAGSSERGVCGECGAPQRRTERGWQPTCAHTEEAVPSLVLDPFSGSGTVAVSALRNGRAALGIELNPEYVRMSRERIAKEGVRR